MSTPAPRPALKKAADAHIHPAAPGHSPRGLRQAADAEEADGTTVAVPADGTESSEVGHRLSGPPRGTTSDSLRSGRRSGGRRGAEGTKDKLVDLGVKVPKALRKDLRAAAKAGKRTPDEVVTALLQGWLNG